jgi:hypothetical protein
MRNLGDGRRRTRSRVGWWSAERRSLGGLLAGALTLGLSLGLAACGGDDDELGNVFSVEPGTCFSAVPGDEVRDLPIVDCAVEHENEVYAVVEYEAAGDDDEYPGEAALSEFATSRCQAELERYVGRPYAESSLEIAPLYPGEDSWDVAGDRTVVCALFARDGDPLIGSARNTAR